MKSNASFYREINQSNEPIDNQIYIEQTSILMESVLKTKSTMNTILILGAGNMHDMSLVFFLRNFKHITLTDIDIGSIQEHLEGRQDQSQISVQEIDYLGLDKTAFFDNFSERLLMAQSRHEVEEIIHQKMSSILGYHFSDEFDSLFDVIYVSPIYTQLLYRQVEQNILSLSKLGFEKEFQEIALSTLLQNMIKVIDHFNREVCSLLNNNGIAFVASDIFILKDDNFSRRIKHSIKSYDVMEEIYHNYQKTYGYGLGDYGLFSISKLLSALRSKWFIWNQSEHQTYAVKFRAFEKIDEELGG